MFDSSAIHNALAQHCLRLVSWRWRNARLAPRRSICNKCTSMIVNHKCTSMIVNHKCTSMIVNHKCTSMIVNHKCTSMIVNHKCTSMIVNHKCEAMIVNHKCTAMIQAMGNIHIVGTIKEPLSKGYYNTEVIFVLQCVEGRDGMVLILRLYL